MLNLSQNFVIRYNATITAKKLPYMSEMTVVRVRTHHYKLN